MLLLPLGTLALVAHIGILNTAALPGRVVAAHELVDSRGRREFSIEYAYTSDDRQTREGVVRLNAALAGAEGLTVEGALVNVKVLFGEPFLLGGESIYVEFPLIMMGTIAFAAIMLFFLVDGEAVRKSGLALRGTLTRGRLNAITTSTAQGSATFRYTFQTDTGPRAGKEAIKYWQGADLRLSLGLDRRPVEGDEVWLAYDPKAPAKSTIYAFGEDESHPVPSTPLAALPPELAKSPPRTLPAGAPSFDTESSALSIVFLGLVAAGFAVNAIVGLMTLLAWLAIFGPFYFIAVSQKRNLLRSGTPLAAKILHVAVVTQKRLSVTFVAETPQGAFRGKERLHPRRLKLMGANPSVGGTLFLVYRPGGPWDRVVWGFSNDDEIKVDVGVER